MLVAAGCGNGGNVGQSTTAAGTPSNAPRKMATTVEIDVFTSVPPPPLGTPIPIDSLRPVTLMFCEPLSEPATGTTRAVAVVPAGTQVYYKPGTCEPDIDTNGMVATATGTGQNRQPETDASGNIVRVKPTYTAAGELFSAAYENVVWTSAKGDLNGVPAIMTGQYLKRDARVAFDPLGAPILTFNMTDEGSQIFGSITQRLIGMPLASFLDGQPLRGEHGQILAPTIQSQITTAGQFNGLSLDNAKRLAALIDNGQAQ